MLENIHKGHRERLRQRFIADGLDTFMEHEILELLLFYVIPQANTNATGHRLITRFGSLANVLSADPKELAEVLGINMNSSIYLKFIGDLCRRYIFSSENTRSGLVSTEASGQYFTELLKDEKEEIFVLAVLDVTLNVINEIRIPVTEFKRDGLDSRKIAEFLLLNNAKTLIVGHNHIGRASVPDDLDYMFTSQLSQCLSTLKIKLLDHVICGEIMPFSMRDKGSFNFS